MRMRKPLAVLLALAAAGCSAQPTPTGDQLAPAAVSTARVVMADLPTTFEAGGVVQARTTATLTARILAPVREVRVAPGDRIRAGETLVVLDADALASQARSATAAASAAGQAAVAAAAEQRASEASLALARASYDRIASLNARRSATAQELDNATATLRAAEARVASAAAATQAAGAQADSARSAADAAGTTAGFGQVKAPFNGVVTQKMLEPGNMAAPGMPLLRVEEVGSFRLEVRVDESRISRVEAGQTVEVVLDLTSGTQQTLPGTVAEVSRAVDVDARAFLIKIVLPQGRDVRSGTFGRARFSAGTRRGLRLPDHALVRRGQLTSVFVVDQGVARLRLVNVSGNEVLAGLSEGDTVVVAPPPDLVDGRRVTPGAK